MEPIECEGSLRCELFQDGVGRCVRACSTGESCNSGEICAYQVCVPASSCDGCEEGRYACDGNAARRCERVNGECFNWAQLETCTGSNVCVEGACVGTVPLGGTCSDVNACLQGLVCPTDLRVCMPICSASSQCESPSRCHILPTTQGRSICTTSQVPTVEAQCTVHLGAFHVEGDWDNPLIGATNAPDPYVAITAPGQNSFNTGMYEETRDGNFDSRSPAYPFGAFHAARLTIYDDDDVFSGADVVADWVLSDQYPWSDGSRRWDFMLRQGGHSLAVIIECSGD